MKIDTYHNIDALWDKHGIMHMDSEEILDVATKYYEQLYSSKPSERNAHERVLVSIKNKISQLLMDWLIKPITLHEIKASINCTALRKSLREDGLSCEYYKALLKQPLSENEFLPILIILKSMFNHIQEHNEISET